MKFRVRRTSQGLWNDVAPCPGAHLAKYTNDNGVERILWTVSFRGLPDLLEFVREQGEVIIDQNMFQGEHEPEFSLEIYDDYRE